MLNITMITDNSDTISRERQLSDSLRYQKELSENSSRYHISLEFFEYCLESGNKEESFFKSLEGLENGQTTLECLAWIWMIPVVIVKYYYYWTR